MIESEGWKIKTPSQLCICRTCSALFHASQESARTEDMCRYLMSQARCTGETTSITDPSGATMAFRPLFVLVAGSAWDHDSDAGYADYAVTDSAPGSEVYLSDLLELDIPAGVN